MHDLWVRGTYPGGFVARRTARRRTGTAEDATPESSSSTPVVLTGQRVRTLFASAFAGALAGSEDETDPARRRTETAEDESETAEDETDQESSIPVVPTGQRIRSLFASALAGALNG